MADDEAADNMLDIDNNEYEDERSRAPSDDSSISTGGGEESTTTDAQRSEEGEVLAQKETRNVLFLRVAVMMVLLFAATAVSVAVYMLTDKAENAEFETQFHATADQVLDSFLSIAEQKIGAISALSVAAIAHGIDHSRNWPFVALSSFQQRAFTARNLAGALFVSIAPLVTDQDRTEWENSFTVEGEGADWIEAGVDYQLETGASRFTGFQNETSSGIYPPISNGIHDGKGLVNRSIPGPYLPYWQSSPIVTMETLNEDIFQDDAKMDMAKLCISTESVVVGRLETATPGDHRTPWLPADTVKYRNLLSLAEEKNVDYLGDPISAVFIPMFDSFGSNVTVTAVMVALLHWGSLFRNILPQSSTGSVVAVLENLCYGSYSYEILGPDVKPLGSGDLHDSRYGSSFDRTLSLESVESIVDGTRSGLYLNHHNCPYTLHVFPTRSFEKSFESNTSVIATVAVACVFIFAVCLFLFYDRLVESRQKIVLKKAVQSTAIVSSIFPKSVQERLMASENNRELVSANHRIKTFLNGDKGEEENMGVTPIADLFPNCTVMFADIAGFTAWSSARDPSQVFHLLQSVYQSFDSLAHRRKVFKVETIGDSYVAVAGLPEPQEKHALIMARFANDCAVSMTKVTKELEVTLGPDTGDLCLRIGLHSGPVTAGVLRGDRARFQLFGDTVNTAARMESTGTRRKIQISKETASLLEEVGKGHWVTPRQDIVEAKGKGTMSTFWLQPRSQQQGSVATSTDTGGGTTNPEEREVEASHVALHKHERLIDWMVKLLMEHLKKVVSKRTAVKGRIEKGCNLVYEPPPGITCMEEVKEAITLPKFDPKAAKESIAVTRSKTDLNDVVCSQLREYVAAIAGAYHENPFHNFEHACHVCMSTNKLLKRIVAPDFSPEDIAKQQSGVLASRLHDYTHGINSDPLALLGIVFSALIHDVDHRGVSNERLCVEEKLMGEFYRGKSVAEQNSVDVAWTLLMSSQFDELRGCMFGNRVEMMRFRQVLVNMVLATDIFDKELNELRKTRWSKAFYGSAVMLAEHGNDLKATIVIEHIIQASDVSHTMQHWHIYRKWNERLFREMSLAFAQGRMGSDPADFWYQGEIGFFDNYIIPLAKKLKECGVFGVSSDEYLNYAINNRNEWEEKGQALVSEMVDQVAKERHASSKRQLQQ